MDDKGNEERYMQGVAEKNDPVGKLTQEQMLEELENDVKAYTTRLEQAQKDLANYKEQLDIDNASWDILLQEGSLKMLNPTYAFQENPEWTKLQEKKQIFKIRQERATADGYLKQVEAEVIANEKALEKAKAKVKKFTEE